MSYTDLGAPRSRNERYLMNMLGASYETGEPQSRIEYLLKEILDNGGGGGGGTMNYNQLNNKPKINDVELQGNLSLSDLDIDVDNELSTTSEKAVQNKVVTLALNDKLSIAATMPTASSSNLGKQICFIGTTNAYFTKGSIYECQTVPESSPVQYKWEEINEAHFVVDAALSDQSENAVQNKVVTLALDKKLGVAATMPEAAAALEGKQLLYVGDTSLTYTKGLIYECQEIMPETDPKTYHWVSISASNIEIDNALSTTSENPVQNKVVTQAINERLVIASTMPEAAAALEGKWRLYTGTTNVNYTKGNIYECQEITPETDPKTYHWVVVNVHDIDIDAALSDTSENPVQNKIIKAALDKKLMIAETSQTAEAGNEGTYFLYIGTSTGSLEPGVVYVCEEITPETDPKTYHWVEAYSLQVDAALSTTSEHAVQNKVVTEELRKRLIVTNTMPIAAAALEDTQRLYVGETDSNYTTGNIYECREITPETDPKTYHWVVINKADIEVDSALSDQSTNPVQNAVITAALDGKLAIIDVMPHASAALENMVYFYIGADTADYTKGVAYECQEITPATDPKTYEWVSIIHATVDLSHYETSWTGKTAAWQALSAQDKALYKIVHLTDDIYALKDVYSTTETKTYKVWIDGKPIYRKVLEINDNTSTFVSSDIDTVVSISGNNLQNTGNQVGFPYVPAVSATSYENWYCSGYVNSSGYFVPQIGTTTLERLTKAYYIIEYTKTTD